MSEDKKVMKKEVMKKTLKTDSEFYYEIVN